MAKHIVYRDADAKHEITAIEHKQLSNGQLAVRLRCCDDPTTDHWHTIGDLHIIQPGEPQELGARIDAKLQKVAAETVAPQHESMKQALEYLSQRAIPRASESSPEPTMKKLG